MASSLASYLPPSNGFLPTWLLFISIVSLGNSIQSYISLAGTREVYAGSGSSSTQSSKKLPEGIPPSTAKSSSPVTELSARTFGTWTALSSIIRLYAAYHIQDPVLYQVCMWTFGIAFLHFTSEWLVFGTAKLGRGLAGPLAVASGTGVWMLTQWSYYVK